MDEKDKQGAVPGVTVSPHGTIVVDGPEAIAFFRLLALRGAVNLEAVGLRYRGGSVTARVKREFGIKGNRDKVLAWLEAHIEAERVRQNAVADSGKTPLAE